MEDCRYMVKFVDVELEELEKNTARMSESIRDEGVSETKRSVKKVEPSLSIASEILKGIREAEEEVSLLEEVDVLGPQVSMEDSRPKVNFSDLELRELERESIGVIESNRDDDVSETRYLEHSMKNEEPIPSTASEILKGIKEGEEEMPLVEEGSEEEMHENGVKAVVVSAEVGGENDINVEQVDVSVPRVSMEDSSRKATISEFASISKREVVLDRFLAIINGFRHAKVAALRTMPESALAAPKEKKLMGRQWF